MIELAMILLVAAVVCGVFLAYIVSFFSGA